MERKTIGLLIILVVLIALIAIISTSFLTSNENSISINQNSNEFLGKEDYGSVKVLGPYGNTSSNIKIAYIVGVHPQENKIHNTLVNLLPKENNLHYSYYIYEINASKGANDNNMGDYSTGRMNGQLLAQSYVVPHVLDKNYTFVIDVHSNEGNWEKNQFLFAPESGGNSQKLGEQIVYNCSFLTYFVPPSATSPEYVTLPIINGGIPAIIYEEYYQNSNETMKHHIVDLINTVDSLQF